MASKPVAGVQRVGVYWAHGGGGGHRDGLGMRETLTSTLCRTGSPGEFRSEQGPDFRFVRLTPRVKGRSRGTRKEINAAMELREPPSRSPLFPGGGGERLRGGGCETENVKKEVVPSLKRKGVQSSCGKDFRVADGEQQCLGDRIVDCSGNDDGGDYI